jgi:hypothetical protein
MFTTTRLFYPYLVPNGTILIISDELEKWFFTILYKAIVNIKAPNLRSG